MKTFEVVKRFFAIPFAALAISYVAACGYWVATGCRYGVKRCTAVFIAVLPYALIVSAVLALILSVIAVQKIKRIRSALDSCRESGADEESVKVLDRELERCEKDKEYRKLLKASALLSCDAFEKCCEALDSIDFSKLTSAEEEEYFNMLVYSRLMQGDYTGAVEIYLECGHYFKRALSRFGTEHITLAKSYVGYVEHGHRRVGVLQEGLLQGTVAFVAALREGLCHIV